MSKQKDTRGVAYTERLENLGEAGWKRWLDVQAPYRWNIRHLDLGFTLDVGCGIGRNLLHLDGHGVGIDHNPDSIEVARQRGCTALTLADFDGSEHARLASFDSLLLSHVVEHMGLDEAVELVGRYLPFVRPGGKTVLIAPQEAGYRSDETHVEFMDFDKLGAILERAGLEQERGYSFPFPRMIGKVFLHNEFVAVGRRPQNG